LCIGDKKNIEADVRVEHFPNAEANGIKALDLHSARRPTRKLHSFIFEAYESFSKPARICHPVGK
jgi:hypothetical protein